MSVYFELRGKFFLTLWIQTFEVQADGLGAVITEIITFLHQAQI